MVLDVIQGLDLRWKRYRNSHFQSTEQEHGYRDLQRPSPGPVQNLPWLGGFLSLPPFPSTATAGSSDDLSTCQLQVASIVPPAASLEMAVHVKCGSQGGRQQEDRREISASASLATSGSHTTKETHSPTTSESPCISAGSSTPLTGSLC